MDSYGQMVRHWDVGCVGCSLSRCEVMVVFDPGDLPGPLRRLRLGRFRRFGWLTVTYGDLYLSRKRASASWSLLLLQGVGRGWNLHSRESSLWSTPPPRVLPLHRCAGLLFIEKPWETIVSGSVFMDMMQHPFLIIFIHPASLPSGLKFVWYFYLLSNLVGSSSCCIFVGPQNAQNPQGPHLRLGNSWQSRFAALIWQLLRSFKADAPDFVPMSMTTQFQAMVAMNLGDLGDWLCAVRAMSGHDCFQLCVDHGSCGAIQESATQKGS